MKAEAKFSRKHKMTKGKMIEPSYQGLINVSVSEWSLNGKLNRSSF